jgi:hypothetical protein
MSSGNQDRSFEHVQVNCLGLLIQQSVVRLVKKQFQLNTCSSIWITVVVTQTADISCSSSLSNIAILQCTIESLLIRYVKRNLVCISLPFYFKYFCSHIFNEHQLKHPKTRNEYVLTYLLFQFFQFLRWSEKHMENRSVTLFMYRSLWSWCPIT